MWKIKNIYFLSFVLCILLLTSNPASAITVNMDFDPDGTDTAISNNIGGWSYDQATETDQQLFPDGSGIYYDLITYQSLTGGADDEILDAGDTFSESLYISIQDSLAPAPSSGTDIDYGPYNLNFQFDLSGYIGDYDDGGTPTTLANPTSIQDDTFTSYFSSGSGSMYVDSNDNGRLDGSENTIASFDLLQADPIQLTPTVFAGGSVGSDIGFSFTFTYVDTDYFGDVYFPPYSTSTDITNLVTMGWLFASATDNLTGVDKITTDDNNNILSAFNLAGGDAVLNAVPEPTTLLLFGTGLLGLAAFGRKKFLKKS